MRGQPQKLPNNQRLTMSSERETSATKTPAKLYCPQKSGLLASCCFHCEEKGRRALNLDRRPSGWGPLVLCFHSPGAGPGLLCRRWWPAAAGQWEGRQEKERMSAPAAPREIKMESRRENNWLSLGRDILLANAN